MVNTIIQDKLSRLGYTQQWLDSKILTEEILDEQTEELNLGEDNNTEHYRYRTLINFFKLQTSFDDKNLEQILLILQSDNDKTMAGSATVILLKVPTLTDKQFGRVTDFLQAFGKWTVKQIDNARINRVKYSSIKK